MRIQYMYWKYIPISSAEFKIYTHVTAALSGDISTFTAPYASYSLV